MGANYANLFEVIAGDVGANDAETRIAELCSELVRLFEKCRMPAVEEIERCVF